MSNKIVRFWKKNDNKILVLLAIILTAIAAFRAGETYERNKKTVDVDILLSNLEACNPAQEKVLALEKSLNQGVSDNDLGKILESQRTALVNETKAKSGKETVVQEKECALVGSKNSNKYHLPSCTWAKKIKAENRVCFSSEEEAKSKGYQPAGCCFKD